MSPKMLSAEDALLLSEHVRSALGTPASATEQVPPHLRANFIMSIAGSAMHTLKLYGNDWRLKLLRTELDRLMKGGKAPGDIMTGEVVKPDAWGRPN